MMIMINYSCSNAIFGFLVCASGAKKDANFHSGRVSRCMVVVMGLVVQFD